MQPYRESHPRESALFTLHALNNAEKHRIMIVATFSVRPPDMISVDPGKANIIFTLPPAGFKPLVTPTKDGAEVCRYTLDRFDPTVNGAPQFPLPDSAR